MGERRMSSGVFRETFNIDGITFWLMLDPGPGWTRFFLSATAPELLGDGSSEEWTSTGRVGGPSYEARAVARRRAIRWVARRSRKNKS